MSKRGMSMDFLWLLWKKITGINKPSVQPHDPDISEASSSEPPKVLHGVPRNMAITLYPSSSSELTPAMHLTMEASISKDGPPLGELLDSNSVCDAGTADAPPHVSGIIVNSDVTPSTKGVTVTFQLPTVSNVTLIPTLDEIKQDIELFLSLWYGRNELACISQSASEELSLVLNSTNMDPRAAIRYLSFGTSPENGTSFLALHHTNARPVQRQPQAATEGFLVTNHSRTTVN